MKDFTGKTYWLVGASEGLGAALAARLGAAGADLVVSARNAERLEKVAAGLPGGARCVPVDVACAESVARAAEAVGQVDGVVYLAGLYWPMSALNWDAERANAVADVNFTGAVRVMGAVLPAMIARGTGHVVLTGSLSGFRGLPGAIPYAASKAGVMALAESMRADLWRSGIRVQLANPGFIRTRLTDKNDFHMPFLMTADEAAREMLTLMRDEAAFARHFPRVFSWVFRLSRLLPGWAYYRIFA